MRFAGLGAAPARAPSGSVAAGGAKGGVRVSFCLCASILGGMLKAAPDLSTRIAKGEVKILGRLQKETEIVWKPEKPPCSGSAEELSLSNTSKRRVRGDMIIIGKCLHREKIPATKGLFNQVEKSSTRSSLWELEAGRFELETRCSF